MAGVGSLKDARAIVEDAAGTRIRTRNTTRIQG